MLKKEGRFQLKRPTIQEVMMNKDIDKYVSELKQKLTIEQL